MPSNQDEQDELDSAFKRFAKQLKKKEAEKDPTKDAELRTRLDQVQATAPRESELFAQTQSRLHQLEGEFQITLQQPQNLSDWIIRLLAEEHAKIGSKAPIAVADLYSKFHGLLGFEQTSMKEVQRTLSQLEKNQALQLQKTGGILVIQINEQFLSDDEIEILDLTARKDGTVSLEQVMVSTKWSQARTRAALESLMRKKMISLKTSYASGTRFHVSEDL